MTNGWKNQCVAFCFQNQKLSNAHNLVFFLNFGKHKLIQIILKRANFSYSKNTCNFIFNIIKIIPSLAISRSFMVLRMTFSCFSWRKI